MTAITVQGSLVTASAEEFPTETPREKWYRILPYGQESAVMASGHKFTVDGPGRVHLPADPETAHVNEEHDRKRPVGNFNKFLENASGLFGRVAFWETQAGSDALVMASAKRRPGISVELEQPVIQAAKLLQGHLTQAGLTVNPSFTDATVLASASDIGEVTETIMAALDKLNSNTEDPPAEDQKAENATVPPETATATGTPAPPAAVPPSLTPAQIVAAMSAGNGQSLPPAVDPLMVLAQAQADLTDPTRPSTVKAAALDTVTQADVFDKVKTPEYAGEMWKGRRYNPRYLDLFTPKTLTAMKVSGWRWVDGKTPKVAKWEPPYSGDGRLPTNTMNDIPTNEVQAEDASWTGFRIAGGHKFDRIHVDFPDAEWWASYNLESTDDFARKLDAELLAFLTTPARLTQHVISETATAEERLLEGLGVVTDFADPDYILLGWDLFKELALAKKFDQSTAAASGGDMTVSLASGSFTTTYMGVPVKASGITDTAAYGRVIAGCRAANELRTLPGGPVRVNAEEITKGAIQHGVFGYALLRDLDKRGMVEVVNAPAAP